MPPIRSLLALGVVSLLAGGTACAAPASNDSEEVQPPVTASITDQPTPTSPPQVPAATDGVREIIVLAPDKPFVLEDGETELSFRRVHSLLGRVRGAIAEDGLPYVKVGDGWLEIGDVAFIVSRDQAFLIHRRSCDIQPRSREDTMYHVVAACEIEIGKLDQNIIPVPMATSFRRRITFNTSDESVVRSGLYGELLVVRSLGFGVGNVDDETTPWTVQSIYASLDVVTNFGVANLDIDSSIEPIIGHEETVSIGPQDITLKILDVANSSTRCNPTCRDVLDIGITVEYTRPVADFPVRIADYNP